MPVEALIFIALVIIFGVTIRLGIVFYEERKDARPVRVGNAFFCRHCCNHERVKEQKYCPNCGIELKFP